MSKFDGVNIRDAIALPKYEESELKLAPSERRSICILVIEPNQHELATMRTGLSSLGFREFFTCHDHARALDLLVEHSYSHVIFSTEPTSITPAEFLAKLFKLNDTFIAIPSSHNPSIHEVFNLLLLGAKGYLSKPFSLDSLDKAITAATILPPIPRSVLEAKDRSAAFAAMILGDFDRFYRAYRQSTKFVSAKNELPKLRARLQNSFEMAKSYCGENFTEAFISAIIELAEGPATRLGRLRQKLLHERDDESQN